MKKLLATLTITVAALTIHAQDVAYLLSGQATNSIVRWGSNSAVALNRLGANASITVTATASNLAYVVTNTEFYAPASTVGVVASFFNASAGTNTYILQKAYDKTTGPWESWTNVSLAQTAAGVASGNFTLTIGDYHYFKVSDITNASAGLCNSNRISFHNK